MKRSDIQFKRIPDAPGVYFFRNGKRILLYVGKATSLRSRVRSYFNTDIHSSRGPRIVKMLEEAQFLEWQETDSVLEALILEANLIKKHQPSANTRDKDNKSFNYLVFTKEDFPRLRIVRGRDLFTEWKEEDIKYLFGPFSSGGGLKEGLKIIRKIFPFRDTCETSTGTPCFNRQIGLCPGVCTSEISKSEYAKSVSSIRLLFEGKKTKLIQNLERTMKRHAKEEKFEQAALVKRQLFALTHIQETALLGNNYKVSDGEGAGRVEAYDVAHISETARVGVFVVVEEGVANKAEYRKFNIQAEQKGDIAALEEILRRRFEHIEWKLPSLIVIDGGVAQKNVTLRVLAEFGYKIPIVHVVKNDKHKVAKIVGNEVLTKKWQKDILLANSEAHRFAISFHRQKRRKAFI